MLKTKNEAFKINTKVKRRGNKSPLNHQKKSGPKEKYK